MFDKISKYFKLPVIDCEVHSLKGLKCKKVFQMVTRDLIACSFVSFSEYFL